MTKNIELYYWPTPNGWKVSIALEELGVPYDLKPVNIGAGEQFKPEFLKISPNNRMPAIIDPNGPDGEPISIFESGAILQYLARKYNKLYGKSERERIFIDQWVMWQMGGLGPMAGQASHFLNYAIKLVDDPKLVEYGINRYTAEAKRLYGVLDKQLEGRDYIASEYSIADIISYPWIRAADFVGQKISDFSNLSRWYENISGREAVKRGVALGEELRRDQSKLSKEELEEQAKNLFGKK